MHSYHTSMAMKRTTVFADEDDLAALRADAQRRGTTEAQLLRDAIHRAAMAARRWDEPFFSRSYAPVQDPGAGGRDVLREAVDERARAYERTRTRPQ